jgi:hypothetical protein
MNENLKYGFLKFTSNGFGLGEVRDLETLHFHYAQMYERCTNVQLTTAPRISPNRCYRLPFFRSVVTI